MSSIDYVVSQDILPELAQYCSKNGIRRLCLVADENTFRVLGRIVENQLTAQGCDIKTIIVTGDNIHTDEHFIVQTMVEMDAEERCFLAVGSGTITDITRFISHRTRSPFISIPTAPSVDGYTSTVAPMVVGNYKYPIQAQPPITVFANLPTLCGAPRIMIAAGVGDLLGKYTSLADWKMGHLLYDEPYNEDIHRMMKDSVDQMVTVIDQVAEGTCEGIKSLMDGLVGSGFGMLKFGESRPASGSEHHIGHYWEIKNIMEGRPAVLHGVEVGVASILAARRYEILRQMSKMEAVKRLADVTLPAKDTLLEEIEIGYGVISEKIMAIQAPLLNMTSDQLGILKYKIEKHWDEIQKIALEVPPSSQVENWISRVGGPTEPEQIGLDRQRTELGLRSAHYLRDRFTINRLSFWLNLPSD